MVISLECVSVNPCSGVLYPQVPGSGILFDKGAQSSTALNLHINCVLVVWGFFNEPKSYRDFINR